MVLTEKLDEELIYNNKKIKLTLWFNRVLKAFELLEDEDYEDYEKVEILFKMFCKTTSNFNIQDKEKIIKIIFDNYITQDKKKRQEKQELVLSFKYDANYVYASFMHQYKIDLEEQIDCLRWEKFITLFQGLHKDTIIKQIMNIRSMEIPKPDKHNAKQRAEIIKLKNENSLLAVMTKEELEKYYGEKQQDCNSLATLKAIAKRYKKEG